MEQEKTLIYNELANEIIQLAKSRIIVNMRFMSSAVNQLDFQQYIGDLATNGKVLYYDAFHLVKQYKQEESSIMRNYMHVLLHCIFRHMFVRADINRIAWDTACDIAVEALITSWQKKLFTTEREKLQGNLTNVLHIEDPVTAEKLYAFFRDNNYSDEQLIILRKKFIADSHELWYQNSYDGGNNEVISNKNKNEISCNSDNNFKFQFGGKTASGERTKLEMIWKKISERIQVDLETCSKDRGDTAGNMLQSLNHLNREKYDYTAFLKKFAILGEKMMINDDEFDYILYTYGMRLFHNMPLIEPLEYKEVKSIRDFVIAIDTSGSVRGEEVQKFITKTYGNTAQLPKARKCGIIELWIDK